MALSCVGDECQALAESTWIGADAAPIKPLRLTWEYAITNLLPRVGEEDPLSSDAIAKMCSSRDYFAPQEKHKGCADTTAKGMLAAVM